jgi:hypothetical protein
MASVETSPSGEPKPAEKRKGKGKTDDGKFLRTQIITQALVVVLAVAAFTLCTKFVLDAYDGCASCTPGTPAAATAEASTNASSVVAVMTPIAAGIVAIVGLFFGISGTGSARGRQAGAEAEAAGGQTEIAKQQVETAKQQAETAKHLATATENTRRRSRSFRI